MNCKTFEIDGQKLRTELKKVFSDKSESEIARMIGFEPGYFHNVVRRNKIGKVAVLWLQEHGISLESYLPIKEEPKEELNNLWQQDILARIEEVNVKLENLPNIRFGNNGQDSALSLTKEELQNVIYRAVYSAVLHAWKTQEEK